MGLSRKINVTLQYRGETRKLHIRKSNDESYLHLLIKTLAYLYFWDDDLVIEPSYRFHGYRPDLLRLDEPDNPKQIEKEIGIWVECKEVKMQKLDDLVRYSNGNIYWFHTNKHLQRALTKRIVKKYHRIKEINIMAISSDELNILIRELSDHPTWKISSNQDMTSLEFYSRDAIDPYHVKIDQIQIGQF